MLFENGDIDNSDDEVRVEAVAPCSATVLPSPILRIKNQLVAVVVCPLSIPHGIPYSDFVVHFIFHYPISTTQFPFPCRTNECDVGGGWYDRRCVSESDVAIFSRVCHRRQPTPLCTVYKCIYMYIYTIQSNQSPSTLITTVLPLTTTLSPFQNPK